MQHLELSIDINASAESVFRYLTDWPKQSEWMLGTYVEVRSGNQAQELGGEIAAFTGIGPIGFWDTMKITKWEPPFQVDVIHTGKVVRGTGAMRVEKISDSKSRFFWSEDLEIPLGKLGLIGFGLLKPFFIYGVQVSLRKFAAQLEKSNA
ncbi:MAG: hypothetical protein RLZZ330_1266 [Actinomycetota bacterium]|jgi:hypothetical protein